MHGIQVEAEFKKLEFPANRRALRDIVRPRTSEFGTEKPCDITTDDEVIVPANALERIKNLGENDLLFYSDLLSTISEKNHYEGSTCSSI